jgi:hypothetical protein
MTHALLLSDVYFPRVNGVSTSLRTFCADLHEAGVATTLVAPDYGTPVPGDGGAPHGRSWEHTALGNLGADMRTPQILQSNIRMLLRPPPILFYFSSKENQIRLLLGSSTVTENHMEKVAGLYSNKRFDLPP